MSNRQGGVHVSVYMCLLRPVRAVSCQCNESLHLLFPTSGYSFLFPPLAIVIDVIASDLELHLIPLFRSI